MRHMQMLYLMTCISMVPFVNLTGFGRWDAARAQLATATAGLAGALAALGANGTYLSEGSLTSCVLPFTAGGFLHIALVTGKHEHH